MNTLLTVIAVAEGIGLVVLGGAFIWGYRTVTSALSLAPSATAELRTLLTEADALSTRIATTLGRASSASTTATVATEIKAEPVASTPTTTTESMVSPLSAAARLTMSNKPGRIPVDPIARSLHNKENRVIA